MIHQPTQEQLAERFNKIPVELRKAIASSANGDTLFEIGKRYNFLIDKTGELAAETGMLMLGITHPDEFVGNLAERLKVDHETASKIGDDINREVLAPVREHLRAMFGTAPVSSGEAGPTPLQPRQKEVYGKEKIPPPPALLRNAKRAGNPPFPKGGVPPLEKGDEGGFTSLEDLEAELAKVLAEEQGKEPLNVIKKPELQVPSSKFRDVYKGTDPYREQVEEDLPNVRPKAYQAPVTSNKKEISEERLPETGRLTSKISPASGGQVSGFKFQVSRTQPTPTPKPVEENSPFLPISGKPVNNDEQKTSGNWHNMKSDTYREPIQPKDTAGPKNGELPKFRGINMQSLPKEQGEPKAPEAPAPIEPTREPEKPPNVPQQKPPMPPILPPSPLQPNEKKDPYKEPII